MFRSLHMKLVLIMLLLTTSLMTVVGAFLMTSVTRFYIDSFYEQMDNLFGEDNPTFYASLCSNAAQEDGVEQLQSVVEAYAGAMGIDSRSRNYYILDGNTGAFLTGSDEEGGATLAVTANIIAARNGEVGDESDISAGYMDVAIPIRGGDNFYILYILDNRATVNDLNAQQFLIIGQALLVGLLISVLLSFLLSKTMITPIERLTESAERMADGDFDSAIEVDSSDEIGILTTTFNDMAAVLKETLSAVENERNKLDTLFLHMTDGVVAFYGDGTIMHRNPAAVEMLEQDPIDLDYNSLFGPLYPFEQLLALQRPNFVQKEMTVRRKTFEVLLAPYSDEEDSGALAVLHDITAQRKNEEMRKEFVANVSHELRTPLTNVRSYAETLRDSEDIPREMENNFLDIIIGETDRMTHIVQDLLTLSRLDSGRTELKMARFFFSDAIENVCRAIELEAQRHRHTLVRDFPGDLPMVVGDRDRLEQVMMNVIGNAVKYTPDGGTIRVGAGANGEMVWMEVWDNGIGIPPEDRERIFDRFYRVDKARSRESGGTGLGLSIARELINRHGGSIRIVDHEGPGTTVRITLPIRRGDGEDAHE